MPECNICGGTSFTAAPNNRLSRKQKPPRCTKCGSLERHRVGRELVSAIRIRDTFKAYALLDVGANRDSTVPKGWFASNKALQVTNSSADPFSRERSKFDFIVCSHVIQKLRDPRRGIQRLVKFLSDDGVMLLNYPSPVTRSATEEFSRNKRANETHFIFGRDFEKQYRSIVPNTYVVAADSIDPVTEDADIMYFLTKSPTWATRMVKTLNARLVQ